jgi:DNA-binding HxlR family transcriptional regulator
VSARRPLRGPGSETLRLLGYPAVRELLADLARRSRRPGHLDREHEVASSTLHRHLPELLAIGAISRRVVPGPPRQVFYGLGPAGPELCRLLAAWLALLPAAPGAGADWRAALGFAEAWAAGLVQALFDGPLTLPEIEVALAPAPGAPTTHQLRRLVASATAAGFLHAEGPRAAERHALAERGRYAVGELAAAARFERLHMPALAVPVTAADVVGALRSHLPLLELPAGIEGICEFAIDADPGQGGPVAMAWAQVGGGRVVASGAGPPPRPAASWARGGIEDWIRAVIEHRPGGLRAAGERALGRAVIDALHARLYRRYGPRRAAPGPPAPGPPAPGPPAPGPQ